MILSKVDLHYQECENLYYTQKFYKRREYVESVELDGPVRGESDEPDEEFLPGDSIKRNQTNESQLSSTQLPVTSDGKIWEQVCSNFQAASTMFDTGEAS